MEEDRRFQKLHEEAGALKAARNVWNILICIVLQNTITTICPYYYNKEQFTVSYAE